MVSQSGPVQPLQNLGATSKIVVYTSSGCQKCTALKSWLEAANKQFEERDLEDIEVMTELVMKNVVVLSAPALEVDERIYVESQMFEGNALVIHKLRDILEGNSNG